MTKIGAEKVHPQPSERDYHKQLGDGIIRFENALSASQVSRDPEEREHLQAMMNQEMELINSAVKEIKRLGIQKQADIVQSDYNHYREKPTPENLTALQQDISTLKEYNYSPQK